MEEGETQYLATETEDVLFLFLFLLNISWYKGENVRWKFAVGR